jgi:nucleoside-diphosphate-sugar epimerase
MQPFLVIFGSGYCGGAVAELAVARGWRVGAMLRNPDAPRPAGVGMADAGALARATHLLVTAPPTEGGDPCLAAHAAAIAAAPGLRWIGYLSTTGVYGNRDGGWVEETTEPAPSSDRTRRRVAAEQAWAGFGGQCAVDIFRLAGIYGPGRSAFDDLRAGTARRTNKPGHCFGRIHRDDIAMGVLVAAAQARAPGARILNFADDEPTESATVLEEAARLLGIDPPPAIPFQTAWATMSPMARSFWAENRKVSAARTKVALGISWRYPTYREGLRAILSEEAGERLP